MHKVTILPTSSPNQRQVACDSCACSEPKWPTLFVCEVGSAHHRGTYPSIMCIQTFINIWTWCVEGSFPCCQQPLHLFIYCGKLSFFWSRWNALKASAIRRPSLIILGSLRAQGKRILLIAPPLLLWSHKPFGFPDLKINFIALHWLSDSCCLLVHIYWTYCIH
jgi:hypothetical protein